MIDSLLHQARTLVTATPDVNLAVTGFIVLMLAWRTWRFTIVPIWWPNEPKLLPYWFPIIGHTWAFARNPEKLIDRGYKYFGNSQPFALTVAGSRTVIIRDVQDVAALWRNTADLSFDPFVKSVFTAFGIAPSSVEKVFTDPQVLVPDKVKSMSILITENPQNKCYINLERDWFKMQLLAPEKLQNLMDKYTKFLRDSLAWEEVSGNKEYVQSAPDSNSQVPYRTISLEGFTRYTLSHCSRGTFFGSRLLEVAPSFGEDYKQFEEDSWKIFYRLPWFLARKSHAAKSMAINGLETYLSSPLDSECAWLFRTMDSELRYISVPPRDVAGIMMIILWAINNNAHKIAFWILAHLLHDTPFLAAVLAETDAAFVNGNEIDMNLLLTACPHLDAIWYESLRMYNAASAVREAVSPCVIGGKSIRKGDTIIAPFRQFHLHGNIFGPDAKTFDPPRFLENKALARTKGYAPFGGGHTYCPGRLFAQKEIYLFVAMTLWRFEIELEPQEALQKMPKVDENIPSVAAMRPAEDVLVRIRPRVHK